MTKPFIVETMSRMELMRAAQEGHKLKRLVRKYLRLIAYVPRRAVDCNQELVEAVENEVRKIAFGRDRT